MSTMEVIVSYLTYLFKLETNTGTHNSPFDRFSFSSKIHILYLLTVFSLLLGLHLAGFLQFSPPLPHYNHVSSPPQSFKLHKHQKCRSVGSASSRNLVTLYYIFFTPKITTSALSLQTFVTYIILQNYVTPSQALKKCGWIRSSLHPILVSKSHRIIIFWLKT